MNWHRLFGLILTDFFTNSPFNVELEKDLALQKQLLDILVVRRRKGSCKRPLPDGLENLSIHNLITFKSFQQALTDWALKELTGHYVNYRKQCSPGNKPLLPEKDFRLYAICSRYPQNLANDLTLEELQSGVYQCRRGTDVIRVIVAGQVSKTKHNALLNLFSASGEAVGYGAGNYEQNSEHTSSLLTQLFEGYEGEKIAMPYTMADFQHEYAKEHFKDLTPEERREAMSRLPLEERLADSTPEEIEVYLKNLKSRKPARKEKPRRRS